MRLEKLSAMAELVSAIAIVVTLGYLAIQTQQNTTAVQAEVRQSMLANDLELLFRQMEYPHVASGEYAARDLTSDEEVQLISWLTVFVRVRENQWLQYKNGVIDEKSWATYRSPIRNVLSQEFSRHFWEVRSAAGEFDSGFVDDINSLLANTPIRRPTSFREALGLNE